jgi:hypothetical protein
MKSFKYAALFSLVTVSLSAVEVLVIPSEGQDLCLEIDSFNTLEELDRQLADLNATNGNWILLAAQAPYVYPEAARESEYYNRDLQAGARDFYYTPSAEDKNNISFIVKTLANHNEASLLFKKGQIEAAGSRVEHIHPLKFLQTIFSDEELKVGMRNIRKKSWVWRNFRSGLCDSLSDETNVGNMHDEYLVQFCKSLDLDPAYVTTLYQQHAWRDFVEALVSHVPRKGDHRRYDM